MTVVTGKEGVWKKFASFPRTPAKPACHNWRSDGEIGRKAHPHMLGFALANKGHDRRALQAYLGHRDVQHTVRYTESRAGSVQGLLAIDATARSA
jgi:site-specific recombinase XerD